MDEHYKDSLGLKKTFISPLFSGKTSTTEQLFATDTFAAAG